MLEAQLRQDKRIVPVVILSQSHPTAPTEIKYKATTTYAKMDDMDRSVFTTALEKDKKELATLKTKGLININFDDKKDGKENEKKDNKKDS